ncbi:hypothetical protein Pcinc_039156 [Petrolisthes cinctipes]|uniref:Uncharacterized protein n=1 Tax=Petrolisthes cinctipes TaxID=88211 RepID=A0AAE1BPI2_PETCI|nr:hypothetical protein Pcinc_039156 [Petrolisthes cinctipes]
MRPASSYVSPPPPTSPVPPSFPLHSSPPTSVTTSGVASSVEDSLALHSSPPRSIKKPHNYTSYTSTPARKSSH